jgi:hypothetical protein
MQGNLQYYEFVVQLRYVNDFVQNTHLHIFPSALASESLCTVEAVFSTNHFLKIYTTYQDACQSVSLDLHRSEQHLTII